MGCGGSKDNSDKEIDYNMVQIQSGDLNPFFQSCESVLKTAEDLRSGWEDSFEIMSDISSVQYLKNPPTLVDAVKVWVWTLSANCGGEISKCKISASSSSPYLDASLGKECDSCKNNIDKYCQCTMNQLANFKEALKNYIKTCITGVKELPNVIEELAGLIKKANDLKENASNSLSHLGFTDKAKNLANIGKNTLKLTKAAGKLKSLQPLVAEAVKNVESIIKELPEIIKTADEFGKKAIEKKLTYASDIMQHLHPADKFNTAQIKQMKVEAEKKRQANEEAKKKKANLAVQLLEIKKKFQQTEEK